MCENHNPLITLGVIIVVVASAIGPVVAHEEQTVEGYDVTFGGADEPLITSERMWLELEIVDNETGEPVENQAETLQISVQKSGGEKVGLDVSEKYGEPGVYEMPIIFTEPGDYIIHVEGHIEGTELHTHFKKEVHDATHLEYPGTPSTTDTDQTNSTTADNQNESITDGHSKKSGFGVSTTAGIAIVVMSVMAVIGTVLFRRQH